MKHAYAHSPGLVLAALEPGEKLAEQLTCILDAYDAEAAVVATAIGSLDQLSYSTAQLEDDGNVSYTGPTRINAAVEIAALQGHLGRTSAGVAKTHLHGTFVRSNGTVVAGHFIEGRVLITVEIGLLLGADVRWQRTQCTRIANGTALPIFDPQPRAHHTSFGDA